MSRKLAAGDLDRRILIYRMVDGIGGDYGEPEESPVVETELYAGVRHLRGREFLEARQINAEITTVFTVRWGEVAITPKHRIVYEGAEYDIFHSAESSLYARREALDIMAAARNE